jgi:diguanylate cyclase (GGDEF)-like protein
VTDHIQHSYEPFIENRRSFILLRWLLVILCSYLVLAGDIRSEQLSVEALVAVVAFFLSNLAIALLPASALALAQSKNVVVVVDAFFISVCLYLLRVEGPQIHIAFMAVFLIAVIWTNLRLIVFSLLASSTLFGAFSFFGLYGFGSRVPAGDFLPLAVLFVVAIFYVFLSSRFDRDSATATVMFEERRTSEIMVEMTRTLAASMDADDIYKVIVSGLGAAMPEVEFRVVRIRGEEILVEASSIEPDSDEPAQPLALNSNPVLKRAYEEKKTLTTRADSGEAQVAVPMITQGDVVGLIWCRGTRIDADPSGTAVHLFEVVASTAANSLRNVGLLEEMKHIARTDFLTGLPNHRYFQQTLRSEMGRAKRHQRPLSLLVLDLDFLKSVNDRFGHPTGDTVIRSVGETINATCREIDFAARYGGEEFVVILPDTDLGGAVEVAERLRKRVHETDVGEVGQITASIGVANYPVNALTSEDLVWVADQALYVAKNGGRNQVAHFTYELTNQ